MNVHTFHYKFARVTLFALSPHPFGLTSRGFTFIDNVIQILGHFTTILTNVFQGSIIATNGVLYPISYSSDLGILDIINYIFSRMQNYTHHLQMVVIPLLHFLLHFVVLLFNPTIFANFESPLN
jgi:hypothetical protein